MLFVKVVEQGEDLERRLHLNFDLELQPFNIGYHLLDFVDEWFSFRVTWSSEDTFYFWQIFIAGPQLLECVVLFKVIHFC